MSFIIGLLTIALLLNCLLLVLLVLIQLPKKEAGMGLAFGAGATDTLFGAGAGNALTKLTKYSAGIFIGLVMLLYVLGPRAMKPDSGAFDQSLKQEHNKLLNSQPVAVPSNNIPVLTPAATNQPKSVTNPPVADPKK